MKRSETTGSTPHVAVIGLGYIGLPTAAVLAAGGADVTGMDVNLAPSISSIAVRCRSSSRILVPSLPER